MSWKMMLGVHHLPVKLTPAEYRVAMVLADHADEEGRNCWPSQATIVAESQLSVRTVRDAQHALVEKGVIEVDRPATATDSARWRVTVEVDFRSRPCGYAREAKSAGGSGNSCRGVRQNLPEGPAKSASEPVLEPVQEPRREVPLSISPYGTAVLTDLPNGRSPSGLTECDGSPPDFEWWYSCYPRHEGRGQAERAWRTAVKKAGGPEVLIRAIEAQLPSLRERDTRYIPLPATWLNGQRWLDEPPKSLDERMIDGWVNGASA